jgi:hypothetical protein
MGAVQTDGTVVIASGQTVSSALFVGSKIPAMLQLPIMTSTALTFQGSYDGATYQAIYLAGVVYSETVASSKDIALDGSAFAGCQYIKVVAGSAEGAERTIVVISRAVGR